MRGYREVKCGRGRGWVFYNGSLYWRLIYFDNHNELRDLFFGGHWPHLIRRAKCLTGLNLDIAPSGRQPTWIIQHTIARDGWRDDEADRNTP
jgi:hypothetical protein